MKRKLSARTAAMLTNFFLVGVVLVVGVICFFPSVSAASGVDERVYYRGNAEDSVSLMFNVYEGTETVLGILDVLEEYGARATFFLGGCWADDNVACVKKIAERGHEIGSHGYFHRDHDKLTLQGNLEEMRTSVEFLSLAAQTSVTLFAPPSGAYGENTLRAADSLGLKVVMWSKDTIDWRDRDEALVFRRATQEIAGGDLVLMHPMQHTLAALGKILDNYRSAGLSVIPVGENIAAQTEST